MKGISYIVDVINRIIIPDDHKNAVFWAPRIITKNNKKYPGYSLYAYGGYVISLYYDEDCDSYCGVVFSDEYWDYFETEKIGKTISNDFKENINKSIEFLVSWGWFDAIFSAFKNRDFGERRRENLIANHNRIYGSKYEIFDMESNTKTEGFDSKADLLWFSMNNDTPTISLVEYKCTDAAMRDKKYSLPGHFEKMVRYYNSDETKGNLILLLNRKRLLYGEPSIDSANIQTKIVFLFSHVNITRHPAFENGISQGYIKKGIYEMYQDHKTVFDQYSRDVEFAFIEDENADLEKLRVISARDIDYTSKDTVWESIKQG